jgi:hypothetical protein
VKPVAVLYHDAYLKPAAIVDVDHGRRSAVIVIADGNPFAAGAYRLDVVPLSELEPVAHGTVDGDGTAYEAVEAARLMLNSRRGVRG